MREEQREILKFGISLWHIDKHGIVLTARERERERECVGEIGRETEICRGREDERERESEWERLGEKLRYEEGG